VPGARLFDSEESRKPGNETGKPIAKRLNTDNGQIKSKNELSPLVLCTTIFKIARGRRRNFPAVIFNIPDFPSFGICFGFSPFFAVKIPIREICAICGKKISLSLRSPDRESLSHLGSFIFVPFLWQSHHQRSH
jgi:hypothetical protein